MKEVDLILPDWPAPAGVRAAFTLRTGGVSQPPFDSCNIGAHVGDELAAVEENRRRLREYLELSAEPEWLTQVHGSRVVDLDAEDAGGVLAPADGVVTHAHGRVCAIQVADCMPVLLAAADGSAVGAAHGGWRGLAAGVLEATVRAMEAPPAKLHAWLGPAIGQAHFEVGEEVRAAFLLADTGATVAFAPNERGRWQCDLYALARRRLAALGVTSVHGGGWCTCGDRDRFFSYRRDGRCGRMAALIWIQ
ncbi:MAG TPA: peptidoglycan editing factor PgeF [Steroidobacteraceae bacterium]|nr:peptidoglycan editing factor PgeF [Steroidobacteraceae bacterium]